MLKGSYVGSLIALGFKVASYFKVENYPFRVSSTRDIEGYFSLLRSA